MSGRVYLLGVGIALVALALGFTDWALALRPGITEANARRVRPGMTMAEVRQLFGSRPHHPKAPDILHGGHPDTGCWAWFAEDGLAVIVIGPDGLVESVQWIREIGARPRIFTLPSRLRAWLGW